MRAYLDRKITPNHEFDDLEQLHLKNAGNHVVLPPLDYDLRPHKTHIAIYWTLIVLTSGVWPIVLYFALRYGTTLSLYSVFGISLAIPGVLSFYSETKRTWRLWQKNSTYMPIGQTNRWAFDAFQWNFILAAIIITIVICAGCSIPSEPLCAIGIAVLLLQLCPQLLLAQLAISRGWKAPCRISSVNKGELVKPATFTLVEDVIAVDGNVGTAFRQRWLARYEASAVLRAHLRTMDYLWGFSGLLIAVIIFIVAFSPGVSADAGYALGWSLPWVWAAFMAWLTIVMTKSMLKREHREYERANMTADTKTYPA